VGRISRFGLLELSRQHLGLNIMRGSFGECPVCHGVGLVRSVEALALSHLRKIWLSLTHKKAATVRATLNVEVANYLLNRKRSDLIELEERYKTSIVIEGSAAILRHEGHVEYIAGETM
jgi:ribonuclease E